MDAHINRHLFFRSGGDNIPPRLHKPLAHFCSSLAIRVSPCATIQNQFPRPLKSSTRRNPYLSVRVSVREDAPSLATVGVSSTVGQEFLFDRCFRSPKKLASDLPAGKRITFEDNDEELTQESFNGVDIPLFSAGGSISMKFGRVAVGSELIVVDNSSAFRMDENVPLVIPEMNPEAMVRINRGSGKVALIANPNCSTIICLRAATPLHRRAKIDMNVKETATCIGVPFMPANAESANLQFGTPLDEDTARDILKNASGVVDIDDRATPMEVSNKDDVAVGKICSDVFLDGNFGLDIFVCGDQIRKGDALNAVQIAEMLLFMTVVRHVYRSKCSDEVLAS